MLLISEKDRCNPALYSEEELRAALECVDNLFGDYQRGELRGGSMDWEDVNTTHDVAAKAIPRLAEASRRAHHRGVWEREVKEGTTSLDLDTWVAENTGKED